LGYTGAVIVAEATRQAEITRGQGDGEKNRIFAEAFDVVRSDVVDCLSAVAVADVAAVDQPTYRGLEAFVTQAAAENCRAQPALERFVPHAVERAIVDQPERRRQLLTHD
jgi:hypothetical protein